MSSVRREIPRRIIQTGKTRELSLLEQAAVVNLTLLNPDFEYVYFDNADVEKFIDREFPQYRPIFDGFPHRIQKYDFFRYLAVYRLGGFYFDLDVFLNRGIDDLRAKGCIFPFEELTLIPYLRQRHGMDWEIGNYAFGASPEHPFLRSIIDNCVRSQTDPSWMHEIMHEIPSYFRSNFDVLNTTGPGLVSRTLAESPQASNSVHVLFPSDVCDEKSWHNFGDYGVHLMAASWRGGGSYLRRRLTLLWESRRRQQLYAESLRRGPRRTYPLPQPSPA